MPVAILLAIRVLLLHLRQHVEDCGLDLRVLQEIRDSSGVSQSGHGLISGGLRGCLGGDPPLLGLLSRGKRDI